REGDIHRLRFVLLEVREGDIHRLRFVLLEVREVREGDIHRLRCVLHAMLEIDIHRLRFVLPVMLEGDIHRLRFVLPVMLEVREGDIHRLRCVLHAMLEDNMNNVEEALEGQNRFKLLLKLLIFIPFKLNKGSLWISIPSFIWMVLNCLKLAYITELAFTVGACRGKLSSDIIHGHLTLRHALLQGWEASYETPPFPPSIGSFAIYSIEDFKTRINYSVSQYYNIHEHTTGVFEILTNDKLTLEFKYFEYEAGQIVPKGVTFNPGPGLTNRTVDGVIFESQARTAETLFALINGDDLFNTFAGLDEKNAASTGRG
ncbi:hypothetical protein MAR_025613, partial [Mya arenaria]